MTARPGGQRSKHELADRAHALIQLGDLPAAVEAFEAAIAADSRNLDLSFNLALLKSQLGDIDEAAALLTSLLRRKPTYPNAAGQLARLVARFQIADKSVLDPSGLRTALLAENIDHQPVADVVCDWLVAIDPDLSSLVGKLDDGSIDAATAAEVLLTGSSAPLLRNELLLTLLHRSIVKNVTLERLLTAVRARILLAVEPARFADRSFTDLVLALVEQGWNNDHAWAESDDELAALTMLPIDRAALLRGDQEATRRFVLQALYKPLTGLVTPALTAGEAERLKPRSLRETVEPQLAAIERRQSLGAAIPGLRPLSDVTSRRVAGQYETAPYPRWTSLQLSSPGVLTRTIKQRFAGEGAAWLDQAFDVLIAGCGTGKQALQSAAAYGPAARLTALDLSRASLGYAADKAQQFGIKNVSFVHGDILDLALLDRDFDIIECVGVLHHMADWRQGWRTLLARLKPHGLMYIGLYSATARAELNAIRNDPACPAPGCSDAAARAFRHSLLGRPNDAAGGSLKVSRDFYALAAFRDLVLHESEAHVTVNEIAAFLADNRLEFRGFTLEPTVIQAFQTAHPGSGMPGRLADWAAFEAAQPRTFDGMYRFWVARHP